MSKSHLTAEELQSAYGEPLSVSAMLHAREHGLKAREVVGVVADLRTVVGRQIVKDVLELSKEEIEVVHLEVDVNKVSRTDQQHICCLLTKRNCLSQGLQLRKEFEVGEQGKGAIVFAGGRDGYRFSQEAQAL